MSQAVTSEVFGGCVLPSCGNGTVSVGKTTTGEPGTDAKVSNSGTNKHVILDFEIPRGDEGMSAYEVAVKNGYEGTEEEWLASLNGDDGLSAYEVAVKDGYVGTEEEWLASLKGPQGNTGSSVDYPYELVNNLTTDDAEKGLSAAQGVVLKGEVSQLAQDVTDLSREATNLAAPVNSLGGWGIKLASNDSGNVATPRTPIALSTDGDSLEITFNQIDAQDWAGGGYCFTKLTGTSTSVRGIMVTKSDYRVRSDDATWLFSARSFSAGSTLKIAYESGKINFYINGTLDTTYNGQKAITIVSFGDGLAGNYNTYWNGVISNVKVNGVTLDVFKDFTYGTAAGPFRANYFLTDSQADGLSYRPPVMASKTATSLNVYRKLFGAYYIKYPLAYRYKAYTVDEYPSYYDNWGVNPLYLSRLSDSGMSDIAALFWAGEAEVAIRVPRTDEGTAYVGGAAHGFENIMVENGARDFLLLVDNQAVAETGTFSLKEVKDIQVIQKSELVQAYTNSNPWAEVTKNWHWNEDGFEIHSSVKILRALAIDQAQFGMLCVFRHWLGDTSKNYLTNKAVKNNVPFTTYTVTDGWESVAANSPLWHYDHDCTKITEYGERGLGFALEIPESTLKANGGMKVGTNNTKYNKIYFDLTGAYTPSVDEILSATQKWTIFGEPVIS